MMLANLSNFKAFIESVAIIALDCVYITDTISLHTQHCDCACKTWSYKTDKLTINKPGLRKSTGRYAMHAMNAKEDKFPFDRV